MIQAKCALWVLVVLRDLGDKGNIIAVAQLLSRRDKVFNHRAGGGGGKEGESRARHGTTAVRRKKK
jgi:hypothetical protein